mmetsp:Transcript_7001/g.16332  ORF Transcript_7001/g.16332 Transcript_7001/m.16332 type:complete len:385 (-) Transcript_7001:1155-2309(-)
MSSHMAEHASYITEPSPRSFAAHIQLAEHLTSSSDVTAAHTRLVSASATASRPMALGQRRPLMGCSPTAVAPPVVPWCVCAMTPTSASGVCSGPTHCCCAISPLTERSTLLVRKRLEPTDGSLSTRSSAAERVRPVGSLSGSRGFGRRSEVNVRWGNSPRTSESGRSTGEESSSESYSTSRPSPLTCPRKQYGDCSLSQICLKRSTCSGLSSSAQFSWYSAPQSSSTDSVWSPERIDRTCSFAPRGSQISLSTLPLPPAPWSWMATMGLASPSSTHARMTRFILFSISASPRCTALKSSDAWLLSCKRLLAAPPPMPIRYAGPPTLTTHMPGSGSPLSACTAGIWPRPAENMIGLSHSRLSPAGVRCPKVRAKPHSTGSPNLLP